MFDQLNAWLGKAPEDSSKQLKTVSLEYSYGDLAAATDNFDKRRKLGAGAYGAVYKGTLRGGSEVAIKEMDTGAIEGSSGFEEEVLTLSKFRHPNLVTLMGWGRHEKKRYLVYEMLEGGDVCQRLQATRQGTSFSWNERLSVALDAASGLSHMHNSNPKAFHRDIKSANIILDRNGNAKMADFGLSGILKSPKKAHLTVAQIAGTPGYACPAYIESGRFSEQSEVFSFGMVLFELLLNQPPALQGPQGDIQYPIMQTVQPQCAQARERALHALDPSACWPPQVVTQLVDAALRCIDHEPQRRPAFSDLVRFLRHVLQGGTSGAAMLPLGAAQGPGAAKPVPTPSGGYARNPYPAAAGSAPGCSELAEIVLECVHADGVHLESIPLECRAVVLPVNCSSFKGVIGRQFQPELFERLVAEKSKLTSISRSHCELSWEPGGPVNIHRLSVNPLILNRSPVAERSSAPVSDGAHVGFSVQADAQPFLLFRIILRDRALVGAKGPHPASRRPSVPSQPVSSGLVLLECVRAARLDLGKVSEQAKNIGIPMGEPVVIGRQHQKGFFENLLQNAPEYAAFISRAHFQIDFPCTSIPGRRELEITNLSSNVVFVGEKPVGKGKRCVLAEGGNLSFAATQAAQCGAENMPPGSSDVDRFLTFTLRSV